MTFTAPSPTRLSAAKYAVAVTALAATTALTVTAAAPAAEYLSRPSDTVVVAPQPTNLTVAQEVELMASIGLYPVGPGAQIMRNLGMGTPQDILNNLAGLAQVIPGDAGAQLKTAIETVASLLAAAQAGVEIPLLGNVGLPEISVPPMGPAGTIDQVADLDGAATTTLLLSGVKTVLMNGDALGTALGVIGDLTGINTDALETLIEDLPLNVPGTAGEVDVNLPIFGSIGGGAFVSSADKFAIIPTWGLGGTNFALASPTFLSDPEFAKTAILAIAMRNTSRPGGGLAALFNPLTQTVGLNLSNVDGRGTPKELVGGGIPGIIDGDITEYDGNVTVWDITAAYDILSDAPSTVLNPLAWLNSGVGAVSPTYLIPANITDFAAVLEDVTSGQINIGTLNTLLSTINSSIEMFNIDVGDDGNLYVTYNSGNLPLLEPVQFIPRTISYLPGFNISTPVSSSFEDVLTQLVAQGYQDVNMTVDAEGVATFARGFDAAGTQAKFWQNPISWEMGLETPQTIFNSIITGLQENLLNPEGMKEAGGYVNQFELFGNSEIGNLVYRNAASVAVAKFISDALEEIRDTLNPVFNDVQKGLNPVAKALDDATREVNKVIDDGLNEVSKLGVDLTGPMLDANHTVNDISDKVNNGLRGVIGLKPIDSPPQFTPEKPAEDENGGAGSRMSVLAVADDTAEVHTRPADEVPNLNAAVVTIPANEAVAESTVKETTETVINVPKLDEETEVDAEVVSAVPKDSPRSSIKERLDKRAEKTERSLTRAQERAENVNRELRKGNLSGAANEVRKNVENRVDRLGKDVSNGVNKVRDAIGGKKESSSDKGGDSNGGGSGSDE